MTVILEKMAVFLIFLAAGYIFARTKFVTEDFGRELSKLQINFFLTGLILSSVVNKEIEMSAGEVLTALGIWYLVFGVGLVLAQLVPRVRILRDGDTGLYKSMTAFMNNSLVAMPLIASIWGPKALFFASLSNIPFNTLMYTAGVIMLQKNGSGGKLELKRILSTPLIATLTAAAIFAFGIRVPAFIDETLDYLATATLPVAMLCVGMSLGSVPLSDAFNKPKLYLISAARLLLCPLAVWLILRGFIPQPDRLGPIVIVAGAPIAIICPILSLQYGRDGVEGSECVLLSTVLSVVTIPMLLSVLGIQ
ncbi:MAG: AEC family transporter [Oscillospiraceae bacterium]|nr:AEC family transporter [Oscillospiraceae bacterium]